MNNEQKETGAARGLGWLNLRRGQFPYVTGLVLLGILGVTLIGVGSMVKGTTGGGAPPGPGATGVQPVVLEPAADSPLSKAELVLEQRLEAILSTVQGAGAVKVTVFLRSAPANEYAVNANTTKRTVEERDQGGGTRLTTENINNEQMVVLRAATGGGDQPAMISQTRPEVKGVLVVAEGASDSLIKLKLTRAVETVLGIPAYQVTVLASQESR